MDFFGPFGVSIASLLPPALPPIGCTATGLSSDGLLLCAGFASPSSDAPGGGSSGPLRPQAARPSVAASAPIRAMRRRGRSRNEDKLQTPDKARILAKPG